MKGEQQRYAEALEKVYSNLEKLFSYSPFIISLTLSIRQKEARPEKRLTFSDVPLIVPWLDSNFLAETKCMKGGYTRLGTQVIVTYQDTNLINKQK